MTPPDLGLLQTAAYFDLRYKWERRRSAKLLRELTVRLHAHIGARAIFEIGACEASFSQDVRCYAPDAQIFAFEANPQNYRHFAQQKAFAEKRIQYLHRAISDRSGSTEFYMRDPATRKAASKISKSDSLLQRSQLRDSAAAVTVEASSLLDFIGAEGLIGTPSTAWIDVEGASKKVFIGLGDRIDQFQLLLCEVEDMDFWTGQWKSADVFSYLIGRDFVPLARDFEYPYQYNVLFLRAGSLKLPDVRSELVRYYSMLGRHGRTWKWRKLFDSRTYDTLTRTICTYVERPIEPSHDRPNSPS